ncbi:PCI/PINT associated module [Penicillium sp. DV-2018c]|nr:PCI/PINT associated module [Penicillium sp. DV-2018c]KAJ5567834.1 PCI/PINT associated module [Penicillium sp. DV-2018c]
MGPTPVLDQFLASLQELIQNRDGAKVQDFLQLEPPLSDIYQRMISELKQSYAPGPKSEAALLQRCEPLVPRSKGGGSWTAFPVFVKLYLIFLRDMNTDNLLETYNQLKALLNQCVLALGDSQMGVVVLPTVLYLSKILAKLAMGLDRRPDLIAHIRRMEGLADQEESSEKVTLVEKSANVVREAFIKCLTDRTGTPGPHGKPEGKRIGIYLMANLCLKLFFQCGKLRNAEQMFASISAQSPPLAYFPASQRVTYLYYLGRYLFANNLFFPAQIALQAAYDQCHRQAINQRQLILSYLIPCNIMLGRFPSQTLLQRPESQALAKHFQPLCKLIVRGDYLAFRQHLQFGSPTAEWFARKGILFTLRNRCEILVWRSFARKVFMYGGSWGGPQAQAQKGPPPVLNLKKLAAATQWLQAQHATSRGGTMAASNLYGSQVVPEPTDVDYDGLEGAEGTAGSAMDEAILEKYGDYLGPDGFYDEGGSPQPNVPGQLIDGNYGNPEDYDECELDPYAYDLDDRTEADRFTMMQEIESIFASLITQGLMGGYLLHREPRFAIPGAKIKGILPTGFPNVWQTISARESYDASVPGWVQSRAPTGLGAAGGGRVVNLSGARPVGQG